MLQSKISGLTCTQTELHYQGSLTLDAQLMALAGWLPGQKIQVLNVNSGERFETYLIEGPQNSGVACLNGPAARLAQVGDVLMVLSYIYMEPREASGFHPQLVYVDAQNHPIKS